MSHTLPRSVTPISSAENAQKWQGGPYGVRRLDAALTARGARLADGDTGNPKGVLQAMRAPRAAKAASSRRTPKWPPFSQRRISTRCIGLCLLLFAPCMATSAEKIEL